MFMSYIVYIYTLSVFRFSLAHFPFALSSEYITIMLCAILLLATYIRDILSLLRDEDIEKYSAGVLAAGNKRARC